MDGISELQLEIERMSETELSEIHWQYTKRSIDEGYFPGKMATERWQKFQLMTEEICIRMAAE